MAKRAVASGYRQRPDGKYESRFTINGKRYSVYADTLKECKEKEALARERIRAGQFIDKWNITLDRYYKEWKEARKGTIKGNTAFNMESRYKNHIGPALGRRKLVDLEKREIVKLQKDLAMKQKASTVNVTIVQLKCILNAAVEDGIIAKSPADGVKPLKAEEKAASETYHRALTEKEQEQFMRYARQEWLYELLALLLCTGMRIGDADGKISLNQQKPSKHAGLRRFGPEKFLQRNNEFMKERPIFYKKPIKTEKDFSTWLRCFYYTTKAVITEYIYF